MNYKQMVLFEEIIDNLSTGHLRVVFGIDQRMSLGEFRKLGENDTGEDRVLTKKLMSAYRKYVKEDKAYFDEIKEQLAGDVDYKRDKFLTILFNHVYVFLLEIKNKVDDYLVGYDGLEVIYNLYKLNEFYEVYLIDDEKITPFNLFEPEVVEEEENEEEIKELES
jgi:hypothetical protein